MQNQDNLRKLERLIDDFKKRCREINGQLAIPSSNNLFVVTCPHCDSSLWDDELGSLSDVCPNCGNRVDNGGTHGRS